MGGAGIASKGSSFINSTANLSRLALTGVPAYETATGKTFSLGKFLLPPEYSGEWRCDTHPRFSPDARSVVIDSPHGGNGRQMYLIDISEIIS